MKNRFRKKGDAERNGRAKRRRAGHVLDVHVRSSARKRQKRLSPGSLRLLRFGLIGASLLALGLLARAAVKEYFLESPEFTLHTIVYRTDGRLVKDTVLRQAELEAGINLLSVDLDAVRARLLRFPEIKSVDLRRDLPDKLIVAVTERRPMAWLSCASLRVEPRTSSFRDGSVRGLMIDAEGVIIECHQLLPEQTNMPVIHLRDLPTSTPGEHLDSAQVSHAIELIGLSNDLLVSDALVLDAIEVRNDFSLDGIFNSGAKVTFGLEDLECQVRNFQLIHADGLRRGQRVRTADLSIDRNVPVTYHDDRGRGWASDPVTEAADSPSPLPVPVEIKTRPKVRRTAPVLRRAIPREQSGDPELRNILGAG